MNITIRPATPTDTLTIQTLMFNGIDEWGKGIETNLKPWLEVIGDPQHIENNILNPRRKIFMAEHEGVSVGTISIHFEKENVSHMSGLYCDLKGAGLGTRLLHYIMDVSRQEGYDIMECEIYDGNIPSIRLMEKYGAYQRGLHIVEDVIYLEYEFSLDSNPVQLQA